MDAFVAWRWRIIKKYKDIWITPAIVWRKNLIADPSTTWNFIKTKIKSYNDEATDFYDKEILKVGSNYTCLAVVLIS